MCVGMVVEHYNIERTVYQPCPDLRYIVVVSRIDPVHGIERQTGQPPGDFRLGVVVAEAVRPQNVPHLNRTHPWKQGEALGVKQSREIQRNILTISFQNNFVLVYNIFVIPPFS